MRPTIVLTFVFLSVTVGFCAERDPLTVNPPYPRIGTCYGAGLAWKPWEHGKDWWTKLDLIIGGGYDLHYDWDHPRWKQLWPRLTNNLAKLHQVNPDCLMLPYVDVVEGPDNPRLPKHWWALRNGARWSGWPGYFRIDTSLPEVLRFNLDMVRTRIMSRVMFDGVFYDCWGPDDWLVPRTAQLRGGKAIVMVNDWNLPAKGFAVLNGCLAEDELNRVVDGRVDFEDFLARYLRWCKESRRPLTTMLVCHPRLVREDPWANRKRSRAQREALKKKARAADPQMMRFGLATTLMGDGYFGYDAGNGLSRGNWWWYPEYDAPLGYPNGPAHRRKEGLWQREFDGGLVLVNGTVYDASIELPRRFREASTGRVGTRFTIPMFDGRLFLPTDAPATPGPDVSPRLTRTPPKAPQVVRVGDDLLVARSPGGLELRFRRTGEVTHLLLDGRSLMTGGWPVIANRPWRLYYPTEAEEPQTSALASGATLVFRGQLREGDKRIDYTETAILEARNVFRLRYEFVARDDLDIRLWRHWFAFPVAQYAGGTASAAGKRIILPKTLGNPSLLPAVKEATIENDRVRVIVASSVALALVDHRKWNRAEYLLAGYPAAGRVASGAKVTVEMTVRAARQS